MTPLLFVGTLCVIVLRSYTLVRQVERGEKKGAQAEPEQDESAEPQPAESARSQDVEKAIVEKAEQDEVAKGSATAQA
jgi:hypothetical protein